jgi:hypothetical protein
MQLHLRDVAHEKSSRAEVDGDVKSSRTKGSFDEPRLAKAPDVPLSELKNAGQLQLQTMRINLWPKQAPV